MSSEGPGARIATTLSTLALAVPFGGPWQSFAPKYAERRGAATGDTLDRLAGLRVTGCSTVELVK